MNRHSRFEPSVQTRKILCFRERSEFFLQCRWRKPTRLKNESVITTFGCDRFMEALVGCNPGEVGARERVLDEHRSTNDVLGGIQHGVRKLDLSHLCFSLNFYFLMFLRLFPYMFPSLTYSQSFLFPYLLITRDIQDEGEARFRFY